jgi:hypothetical protein
MVVPHEFVAVSIAHGYDAAGERPAAVMVHLTVGTDDYPTVRETLRYPTGREASERRLASPPVHDALAARRVTAERS